MFEAEGGGWSTESPKEGICLDVGSASWMAFDVADRDPVDHTKGDKRDRCITSKNEPSASRSGVESPNGTRDACLFSSLEAEGLKLPGVVQTF